MREFIILMYDDFDQDPEDAEWLSYLDVLNDQGAFNGSSAMGQGEIFRKGRPAHAPTPGLDGYIRVAAETFEDAKKFLAGNPTYENGGTVEIRELPRHGQS